MTKRKGRRTWPEVAGTAAQGVAGMQVSRLAGHTLPNEGRLPWSTAEGPAVCSCGATSEPLASANARQKWHRGHKAAVWTKGRL